MKAWLLVLLLCGCHTLEAANNNAPRDKVVGGMKKDADEVGSTAKRGANEIGNALHDLFRR